ncbi:zinc-binding dehydrogenase [Aquabacter sp. CN5-332]|uniref:zinc-binding dehydrogenase n=1 Tax=Aquabacter sp. CN5-332 TaxID=3156608 RepID=UPI0032B5DD06
MKAVVFEAHGGVEVLSCRDWPDPEPRAQDVIVRVRAVGLNYLDIFARRGMPNVTIPLPFISGGDIAGEIESLGAAVTGWRVGERVVVNPKTADGLIGEEIQGGLAERVRVPASNLVRLPDAVDDDTAAAVPINFGTALRMLTTIGNLRAGETILVLGASGGVGTACVQVAKMIGAEVLAAAGSAAKLEQLRAIGADHAIDYAAEDFSRRAWDLSGKRGVDVVVNFTGGDTFVPSMRALARHGRLLVCGATAGYAPPIDLRYLWRRELQVLGSTGYAQADIEAAIALVAEGRLKPAIGHRFPLAETAAAQQLLEDRAFFGKIVINP